MTNASSKKRTDTASRVIMASPSTIYQAFLNPKALASWLPPKGMTGHVDTFDAREGGTYRMILTYNDTDHSAPGKSSDNTDVIEGKFLEFVHDEKVVQLVEFESEDPNYAGFMKMTWALEPLAEGTQVTIVCENVPEGVRKEDHDEGLRSTLENLAESTEGQ